MTRLFKHNFLNSVSHLDKLDKTTRQTGLGKERGRSGGICRDANFLILSVNKQHLKITEQETEV